MADVVGVEQIKSEILAQHKGMRPEVLDALIEGKKSDAKGLLSDEGAARLVAEELLVKMEAEANSGIEIHSVVAGLNDVTLNARVLASWPVQSFLRRDGTTGQVTRLEIADRTGQAMVVAWDKKAEEIATLADIQGKIVRIEHAYTREGLSGQPELHLGDRAIFSLSPPGKAAQEIPEFHELLTTIVQIAETGEANLQALVQTPPRTHAFQRNGREGQVTRVVLADKTGAISAVFWNERAQEANDLKPGDLVRVLHARLRKDNAGNLEVHVESRSQVTVIERGPEDYQQAPPPPAIKLADLKGGLRDQTVRVQVVRKSDVGEVKRLTGETVKVGRLLVGDETGLVLLSLWDTAADIARDIKEGDILMIRGVSARERYGEISLSAGKTSQIEVEPSTEQTRRISVIKKVNELETAKGLVAVEGTLIEEPTIREVLTGQGENVQIGNVRIADDTGDVPITLWRQHAQLAGKLRKGTRVRLFGVRVRPGLGGGAELSSSPATSLELVQGVAERPAWQDVRQIIAVKEGEALWIRGLVLEPPEAFAYVACPKCNQKLSLNADEISCDSCGYVGAPQVRMTLKTRLDDGTGVLEVQADIHELEAVLGESANWTIKEMQSKRSTRLPLPPMIMAPIAGRKMEAHGSAERSVQTGKLIFHSSKTILTE